MLQILGRHHLVVAIGVIRLRNTTAEPVHAAVHRLKVQMRLYAPHLSESKVVFAVVFAFRRPGPPWQ
jgi:hypothetical protein